MPTITLQSNPSGVAATCTSDLGGQTNVVTPAVLNYDEDTDILINIEEYAAGGTRFGYWERDGQFWSRARFTGMKTTAGNHTFDATYFSPPANDAFADAQVISGKGQVDGQNFNTSVEAGEPEVGVVVPGGPSIGSPAASVWYKWSTVNWPDVLRFDLMISTRQVGLQPTFHTVVQVFQATNPAAPTLETLEEVAYSVLNWKYRFGSWSSASVITIPVNLFFIGEVFTYYIRVSSLNQEDVGHFRLAWDIYYIAHLGGCGGCPISLAYGETCRGTVEVTNVASASVYPFGNFPAGRYLVRYCKGYFAPAVNGEWTAGLFNEFVGWHLTARYNSATGVQNGVFSGNPQATYVTQNQAEQAYACMHQWFDHVGGELAISFQDAPYSDNTQGEVPMTFGLYTVLPVFQAGNATGTWVTATRIRCILEVANRTSVPWPVTATLQESGGVTSPTTVVTTLPAYGTSNLAFEFETSPPGNSNISVRLLFSDGINTFTPLDYTLAPLLVVTISTDAFSCSPAASKNDMKVNVLIRNNGNLSTRALTLAVSGSVIRDSGSCSSAVIANVVFGTIISAAETTRSFRVEASTTVAKVLTFTLTDGVTAHPSPAPVTVPQGPVSSFTKELISGTTWLLTSTTTGGYGALTYRWRSSINCSVQDGPTIGTTAQITVDSNSVAFAALDITDSIGWKSCLVRSIPF